MSTQKRERSVRGTINAADVAVVEKDFARAEEALLAALSDVRRRKAYRGDDDD